MKTRSKSCSIKLEMAVVMEVMAVVMEVMAVVMEVMAVVMEVMAAAVAKAPSSSRHSVGH